ncbi:MAG: type II toxin-antitoxin system RelE/ParE family toxin [Actinomycetia bacterium]|nr:type II toxin-antitoxin system RelE/ParE family toxin [Actinomycetes bacterium]
MRETWTVVVSPEVASWYRRLNPADRRLVDKMLDKLRTLGSQLRMPHSRPLGEGLFELRFAIQQATVDQRITYTFEPQQRIITLTFRKTRSNERHEVARARQAKADHEKESEA